MKTKERLGIQFIHCGNKNITNPVGRVQEHIFYMPVNASRMKIISQDYTAAPPMAVQLKANLKEI